MYQAKSDGHGYRFFDRELAEEALERVWLKSELDKALKGGEMVFHYQPLVALETGRWQGVEALARWFHPEQGWISPGRFIPVVQRTGMNSEFAEWALGEACRQARAWLDADLPIGRIAVNMSSNDLHRSNFVSQLQQALRDNDIPGECLELEITEDSLISKETNIFDRLQEIRGLGVSLAVDDFGTGYSSLAYLRDLHVDKIKIDQSFVRNDDPRDHAIIRAITQMGSEFGFLVLAEGIETQQQRSTLGELGCQLGQGFLFARPAPPEQIARAYAQAVL